MAFPSTASWNPRVLQNPASKCLELRTDALEIFGETLGVHMETSEILELSLVVEYVESKAFQMAQVVQPLNQCEQFLHIVANRYRNRANLLSEHSWSRPCHVLCHLCCKTNCSLEGFGSLSHFFMRNFWAHGAKQCRWLPTSLHLDFFGGHLIINFHPWFQNTWFADRVTFSLTPCVCVCVYYKCIHFVRDSPTISLFALRHFTSESYITSNVPHGRKTWSIRSFPVCPFRTSRLSLGGAIECQFPPLQCLIACRLSNCMAQSQKVFFTMVFQECHENIFPTCHPQMFSRRPHKRFIFDDVRCPTMMFHVTVSVSPNCLTKLVSKFMEKYHFRAVTQMPHKRCFKKMIHVDMPCAGVVHASNTNIVKLCPMKWMFAWCSRPYKSAASNWGGRSREALMTQHEAKCLTQPKCKRNFDDRDVASHGCADATRLLLTQHIPQPTPPQPYGGATKEKYIYI